MARKTEDKCSFCNRPRSEVGMLFTGLNGNICDECVRYANELLTEGGMGKKQQPSGLNLKKLPEACRNQSLPRPVCHWSGRGQEDAQRGCL